MKQLTILIFLCSIAFYSCQTNNSNNREANPPAEGFNIDSSDKKAIEIADKVMEAMGGRKSWDETRYFTWNFFGARKLWWDKLTGDVKIKMNRADSMKIMVNIFDNTGNVSKNGIVMEHPDSIEFYLNRGKGIWINDSYWLFMPFKLKDSGVTLTYVGEDTTQTGAKAEVLQLTFENVGNTPQNKYHVWVDQSDNLVKQWAYYRENNMEEPNFVTPWADYHQYGKILLAGDRGERDITEIAVLGQIDKSFFED